MIEEESPMASRSHSITQLRIGANLLFGLDNQKYTPATETSLDMSFPERQELQKQLGFPEKQELKPDVVLFKAEEFALVDGEDKVRVQEVPILCVEIISPTQNSLEILEKFKVYFGIGVKSCWYVDPLLQAIRVYHGKETKLFHSNDTLADPIIPIEVPLQKIFY